MKDYVSIAHEYAADVIAGRVVACRYVGQACERHQADVARAEGEEWPYRLDRMRAGAVCRFVELFPHIKGSKANRLIELEPWQVFVLVSVFGWVYKVTGLRRFKKAYIEVPRGNAKSTLSAPIALYGLAADGEQGAEVYSAATTRDQARIVFDVARHMVKRTPGFRRRFDVHLAAHAIAQPDTASIFKPLSAEADTLDGLNVHFVVVDELHAHPTRDVFDVLETGTGKRNQSLMWIITTAGNDRAGICYEVRGDVLKILSGTVSDDTIFGIVYTIDEPDPKHNPPIPGDDWATEAAWKKANPNWGVSVVPEVVAAHARKAMRTPSAQNNFLTKYLDIWVNADVAWMDMRAWKACADPLLKIENFAGQRGWGAVDLASKVDVAAVVRLFFKGAGADRQYYAFPLFYLPEKALTESDNSQYSGWVRDGYLRATSGTVTDYDEIEEEIKLWPSQWEVQEVAFDPFQATQFSSHMLDSGFPMVEVGATVKNLSDPMKELDGLVRDGRLHHDGNPVLEWMVSNVVCHYDRKDNVFPVKESNKKKIDGAVALIMALSRAMVAPDEALDGCGIYVF